MSTATLAAAQPFPRTFPTSEAPEPHAKDLLRFITCGSVDDGKSTLIGRLLYDCQSVYDDQLESVTKASIGRNAGPIDFSLLTDGLRAEREQGITIDVAYRYFATPRRKFIIADTPGHEQYTRNMVTGASTAELAVVLIDARKGLLVQSKRHAYIASLLGIRHLVIAVNKMDMVGYSQRVFADIEDEFRRFLAQFAGVEPYFVPVSALAGDNVVVRSKQMPWFEGETLLEHLEAVDVQSKLQHAPFRFPVQRVVRPHQEFRGYAGTVASGTITVGSRVTVLPSGRSSRIRSITTFDGDRHRAVAGEAITLTLADEIDIVRGDVIVPLYDLPQTAHSIRATIVWLHADASETGKRYRLKQATRQEWASIRGIEHRVDINTMNIEQGSRLEMNAIGVVEIDVARVLCFDAYNDNRVTGSFILIDPATNATVAAGLILGPATNNDSSALSKSAVTWRTESNSVIFEVEGLEAFGPQTSNDPAIVEAFERLLEQLRIRGN
jgi:sulfate adenylyltransferase large subunit